MESPHFLTNTKADGSFTLKVPVTGQIKVKFEQAGFESLIKEEVEMKLGKTTEVETELVKVA